ncbi:MAG: HD domain-containing protein [Deltaproteobacteria bacterium]|nr:MAG: HD domain-containing protein [Deltaproteobacteria bacterium]
MRRDTGHDFGHLWRVLKVAHRLWADEGGRWEIVAAAALCHDLVNLPKNHPERHRAADRSATAAVTLLRRAGFPEVHLDAVRHAIRAHSFSGGHPPRTLEARILRDADRLDALGAVGLARVFAVSGQLGRPLFDLEDPFCERREPDDRAYALDHFFQKLLCLEETLLTEAGRQIARRRTRLLRLYLRALREELL